MQILYESCACSDKYFSKLYRISNIKPGQQVQKYHKLLLQGLVKNDIKVRAISAPPITRAITQKVYYHAQHDVEHNIEYHHLPVLNIPILKNIVTYITSFLINVINVHQDKMSVIICDVLNISAVLGAISASKLFKSRCKTIGIVTDMPSDLHANPKSLIVKINNTLLNSFDSFIFLTEDMNKKINRLDKPYLVVEGHVDINMSERDNALENKSDHKIVIYAGGLNKKYGIEKLVQAFDLLDDQTAELHIYGSGDYQDELQVLTNKHKYIKYYGNVPNNEVVNAEIRANLLVNPRPSDEEYTKYSFPSKNMEYMASGTAVLTTKLPGMPQEYRDYVYLFDDESIIGMSKMLRHVLMKEKEELHEKGLSAKKFVLNEKNNVKQATKIFALIQKIIGGIDK